MPTRKQILSILAASAAFIAVAVVAANLDHLETTKSDLRQDLTADAVTGVTVAWVTHFDAELGDDKVVGADLKATDGTTLENSTVDLTIVGADGLVLGTMSSDDGGETWSGLDTTVAAGDSLVASVVINDRETIAAISTQ
jgi:hypothetical protein